MTCNPGLQESDSEGENLEPDSWTANYSPGTANLVKPVYQMNIVIGQTFSGKNCRSNQFNRTNLHPELIVQLFFDERSKPNQPGTQSEVRHTLS